MGDEHKHTCDCCEECAEDSIIELIDEAGNTVKFEHLLTFEYGEDFFAALLPIDPIDDMEDGEVLLMKLQEEDDGDTLVSIETEEELEGAWNAFMDIYYGDEDDENDEDEEVLEILEDEKE